MYSVEQAVERLNEQYSYATSIFGGAIFVKSMDDVIKYLPHAIRAAKFYRWHENSVAVCRRFCNLCLIDPALLEVYIGMKLNQFVEVFVC